MVTQTQRDSAVNLELNELIEHLTNIIHREHVLYQEEDLRPYECDGFAAYRRLPRIVVLPSLIEQVQAILRFCFEYDIPVVARGAGTGLSGGALPDEEGVLVQTGNIGNRLNRIHRLHKLHFRQGGLADAMGRDLCNERTGYRVICCTTGRMLRCG